VGDVEDDEDDRFSLTGWGTSGCVCDERGRDRVIELDGGVDDGRAAFRRSSSAAAVSSDRRKAFATLKASRASLCARIKAF
jgi:hypothetical protein